LRDQKPKCPAEMTLNVIGGRWKTLILYHLFQGVKRFSELQHALDGVSQKVLTQQLRELERAGILHREVYAQVPPKVEYSLTPLGESLRPVIAAMCQWGTMYGTDELPQKSSPC
jgi:DNA-binding HxlR family transcriptional regulator